MLVGIISRSDFDLSIMVQAVISARGWPLPLGIGRSGHSLPLIRRPEQLGGAQHQQHQQEPSSRQYKATPDAAIRPLIVSQHALKCHTADSVETHSSSVPLIAVLVPTCLIVPSKSVASHTKPTPLHNHHNMLNVTQWKLLLKRLLDCCYNVPHWSQIWPEIISDIWIALHTIFHLKFKLHCKIV